MVSDRHFADRLVEACVAKESRLVVGLDPHPELLPPHLLEAVRAEPDHAGADQRRILASAAVRFNAAIIDAVADQVVAVKPQLALYEQWGEAGWQAYEATVQMAREQGLLVIADAKRNDIGSSAEGYARAFLGPMEGPSLCAQLEADAVTVNPYLGSDGVYPFLERWPRGKGVWALVRTSNPSAGEVQDLLVDGEPLYMAVARLVSNWGHEALGACGYSALGAVVGGTDPAAVHALRQAMPRTLFLVPGFGAQGASAKDVAAAFDQQGLGAVINSSRGVIFAYTTAGEARDFATAARQAAIAARGAINCALR